MAHPAELMTRHEQVARAGEGGVHLAHIAGNDHGVDVGSGYQNAVNHVWANQPQRHRPASGHNYAARKEGKLAPDEYEHRFSRMITELRERRIDGSRADILGTLKPLKEQGIISDTDWLRLTKQLGLV